MAGSQVQPVRRHNRFAGTTGPQVQPVRRYNRWTAPALQSLERNHVFLSSRFKEHFASQTADHPHFGRSSGGDRRVRGAGGILQIL